MRYFIATEPMLGDTIYGSYFYKTGIRCVTAEDIEEIRIEYGEDIAAKFEPADGFSVFFYGVNYNGNIVRGVKAMLIAYDNNIPHTELIHIDEYYVYAQKLYNSAYMSFVVDQYNEEYEESWRSIHAFKKRTKDEDATASRMAAREQRLSGMKAAISFFANEMALCPVADTGQGHLKIRAQSTDEYGSLELLNGSYEISPIPVARLDIAGTQRISWGSQHK